MDVYKNNILVGSIFCGFKLDPDILSNITWTLTAGTLKYISEDNRSFSLGFNSASVYDTHSQMKSSDFVRGHFTKLRLVGTFKRLYGPSNAAASVVLYTHSSEKVLWNNGSMSNDQSYPVDNVIDLSEFEADEILYLTCNAHTFTNGWVDFTFTQITLFN